MLIGTVCFIYLSVLSSGAQAGNDCASQMTCSQCIQNDCEWCIDPLTKEVDGKAALHCRPQGDNSTFCPQDKIMTLAATDEEIKFVLDEDFTDDVERPTQIKPQYVKMTLRKGQTRQLKFKFKSAENFPVDMYYVMDLSNSMYRYKNKLAQLGKSLADGMKKFTTNLRLGFGSFIDKVDLPFVNTVPDKLKMPCNDCVPAYSFKNHMRLSDDTIKFVNEVRAAKVSGNMDTPEGGLDALMQAMVCKDEIGWRQDARHLLILSTDAEFHVAGDGKLAGVIEPNPATCYKSDKEFLIYDYPSVSQINYVASENKINIIFTIVKTNNSRVPQAYRLLSQNLKKSKYGELDGQDGSNVVELIVKSYDEIVQEVKFVDNATNDIVVNYTSNCKKGNGNTCKEVSVTETLEFTVTLNLTRCPQDGETKKWISINRDGLSEALIIEIDLLCECPCAASDHATFQRNSSECEGVGDLKCGVCDCPKGLAGNKCDCDLQKSGNSIVKECVMEGSTQECSGLGSCRCGKCVCRKGKYADQIISGTYCECNSYSCRSENGLPCSGHGTCKCNQCECDKGFSGEACECDDNTDKCYAQGSDSMCSGNGVCKCGRCECKTKDGKQYTGKYCNECISCPAQQCNDYAPCVQCQGFKGGIHKDTCAENCKDFNTTLLPALDAKDIKDVKECQIRVDDLCAIRFVYYYDESNRLTVMALDKKICDDPPNALAWILGVVAAILIAGLVALLIWKLFTTIHDRREYAKFENEMKKLKWGTSNNPLYREATSTFANPAYKRNSVRFSSAKE